MKYLFSKVVTLLLLGVLFVGCAQNQSCAPNTLTKSEIKDGWELLFDGESLDKWSTQAGGEVPKGWVIKDGYTYIDRETTPRLPGGSIVTKKEYSAFEFSVEFKLTEHANSGIKYFAVRKVDPQTEKVSSYGLEYQLMDDAKYADRDDMDKSKLAALYAMIPAKEARFLGVGEWNEARIKVFPNSHVEHWLNGEKVLEYERGSQEFRDLVAKSKYRNSQYNIGERFGEDKTGRIMLQDHSDVAYFRSMKIRELK